MFDSRKYFLPHLFFIAFAAVSCSPRPQEHSHSHLNSLTGFEGVLTYHNDLFRTGVNPYEIILTPENVNPSTFGKLGTFKTDGAVRAQPLYVPGVLTSLGTKNIMIAATAHGSLFAFDADGVSTDPLWKNAYINRSVGINPVTYDQVGFKAPNPEEIGITGTPVIDAPTNTIYFVMKSNDKGTILQRLHAVDMASGAEKNGSPIEITAQDIGPEGNLDFYSPQEFQHAGLALNLGQVFIAFGAHGDYPPYHGWLLSYEASTLKQTGAFSTTHTALGGGIWMAGGGVAIDQDGAPYIATGNGYFDGTQNFGDSLIKMGFINGKLSLTDFYSPYNQAVLNDADFDLGSGGVLLVPNEATPGAHLAITGGKGGTLYLVNRDNLGKYREQNCSTDTDDPLVTGTCVDPQIVQQLTHIVPRGGGRLSAGDGIYNSLSFFNNNLFIHAGGDVLKVFNLKNLGQSYGFDLSPVAVGSQKFTKVGATTMISANGNEDAVVWEVQQDINLAILHAYDAIHFTNGVLTELYNSTMAGGRDRPIRSVRFTNPIVAHGKVYVPGVSGVDIYGLSGQNLRKLKLTLDKQVYKIGDQIKWDISGGTIGSKERIVWDSSWIQSDGTIIDPAEESADYDNFTDPLTGLWTYTGTVTSDQVGTWTRTARIGLDKAVVKYTISKGTLQEIFKPAHFSKARSDRGIKNLHIH